MKCFRQKLLGNPNTHFMMNLFPRKSCRLKDNVGGKKYGKARQDTDDNIIRGMTAERWITKATNTHPECDSYCFSTATVVMRLRFSITFYVHCLPCSVLRYVNFSISTRQKVTLSLAKTRIFNSLTL